MERYFLGNNTAYGFFGNYEQELKDKTKVILLKGGPGTGKSTVLKRLAKEAETRGRGYELWYCSGDPKSLDGIFIKDVNAAVVDATAPHATGADLPVIKDVIIDLATSLERDKLQAHADDIKTLANCKKHRFMRAYQHLNLALCHLKNQIALESEGVKEREIREFAVGFVSKIRGEICGVQKKRALFVSAICPAGESVFFDHLTGKKIYKIVGGDLVVQIFFGELKGLLEGGTYLLNPLEPKYLDGIVVGDLAIVKDVGFAKDFEVVDLEQFERHENQSEIGEEKNGVVLEAAFAVEELNKAREYHLELEKYFVGAMDFCHNDRLYQKIVEELFEV